MIPTSTSSYSGAFDFSFGDRERTHLGLAGVARIHYGDLGFDPSGAPAGGTYNVSSCLTSGHTVLIELYDPISKDIVALNNNFCTEIQATGIYIWDSSRLVTQPVGYKEYAYKMVDEDGNCEAGVLRMFDQTAIEQVEKMYQRLGLDAAAPVVNNTDGSYAFSDVVVDATEDVDGNVTHQRA